MDYQPLLFMRNCTFGSFDRFLDAHKGLPKFFSSSVRGDPLALISVVGLAHGLGEIPAGGHGDFRGVRCVLVLIHMSNLPSLLSEMLSRTYFGLGCQGAHSG